MIDSLVYEQILSVMPSCWHRCSHKGRRFLLQFRQCQVLLCPGLISRCLHLQHQLPGDQSTLSFQHQVRPLLMRACRESRVPLLATLHLVSVLELLMLEGVLSETKRGELVNSMTSLAVGGFAELCMRTLHSPLLVCKCLSPRVLREFPWIC